MSPIQKIIDQLELQSHPEGGYFKEVYRSEGTINKENLGEGFSGQRNYAIETGQNPQFVVKAKDWFAAEVLDKNSYSLVGCTVSPGFDFNDFDLPKKDMLISKFPEHRNIITAFTRL